MVTAVKEYRKKHQNALTVVSNIMESEIKIHLKTGQEHMSDVRYVVKQAYGIHKIQRMDNANTAYHSLMLMAIL